MRRTSHHAWVAFTGEQREAILATALPARLFTNQHLFKDFLSLGHAKGVDIQIQELPDDQFALLEKLVDAYCGFCADHWQMMDWTAFVKERSRRNADRPV